MSRLDHEVYFEYAFEEFRERLSEPERCLIGDFVTALKLLDQRAIPLKVVNYA